MGKRILLVISAAVFAVIAGFAQESFPTPDVALTFEGTPGEYVVEIPDISGNDNHAYWYNYFQYGGDITDSTLYAGYHTDEGKFGGSWYISGYHQSCCNMCSSSEDFILLAGNNQDWDITEVQGMHPVWHTDMESMTVMFWFKSNRDYTLTDKIPCPKGTDLGMHEQELLFSHGKRNAIAIANDKGFYNVRVGYQAEAGVSENKEVRLVYNGTARIEKDWQHIAVTFDGANNGALTVYIDGEIGTSGYADPNPVETGYDSIRTDNSSTELGAQNNAGLYGDPGNGVWAEPNEQCCVPEDANVPKYRTGWPAGGYYDEFVFYKDKVLTQEEIQNIMNNGIEAAMGGSGTESIADREFLNRFGFHPNPAQASIIIRCSAPNTEVQVFNIVGATVLHRYASNFENIDISGLEKGVYLVKIGSEYTGKLMVK